MKVIWMWRSQICLYFAVYRSSFKSYQAYFPLSYLSICKYIKMLFWKACFFKIIIRWLFWTSWANQIPAADMHFIFVLQICMPTQWFLLLMTGKGSSSCPVIFYWKEITPCRGCSSVFNGLIALEKAASGNAVIGGNIAWRRYRQQEKVKELA